MGLSGAERQRAYKARQKAKGVDFAKVQRDWRAENKEKVQEHNRRQKANKSAYFKREKGKATLRRYYEKEVTDPGKRLMMSMATRMSQAMHKNVSNEASSRLMLYTEFENSKDVRDHFESLWEPWMNWDNYGPCTKSAKNWNIGHRIPLSYYDANDPEDVRRCWSKDNLFPQDAIENTSLNDGFPGHDVLMNIPVSVFPKVWRV
jgi:hypothetical protein